MDSAVLQFTLTTFVALFVTIDVIGIAPIFVSLTSGTSKSYRKKMARKGILTATLILLFFALSGTLILDTIGITLPAFRIAGGILLLLLSIDMVLAKSDSPIRSETEEEREEAMFKEDISVFPLAIPLLSGPATITMLILLMKQSEANLLYQFIIIFSLLVNMFIGWITLHFSGVISRFLGITGINVLSRIFGILLTALSCQFFIDGIKEAFF